MEMNEYLNKYGIIGIVSDYQVSIDTDCLVKDIKVKDVSKGLQIVGLPIELMDKKISSLTPSELIRVDLLSKLDNDIIIIGNLSKYLNYKDLEYIKKVLIKINSDYHKKIVVFDKNIKVFNNLVNRIIIIDDKRIIYDTNDYYDEKLYEYVKMPKIVEFIKYVNKDTIRLNNTMDIYELIKDIYRSVS